MDAKTGMANLRELCPFDKARLPAPRFTESTMQLHEFLNAIVRSGMPIFLINDHRLKQI